MIVQVEQIEGSGGGDESRAQLRVRDRTPGCDDPAQRGPGEDEEVGSRDPGLDESACDVGEVGDRAVLAPAAARLAPRSSALATTAELRDGVRSTAFDPGGHGRLEERKVRHAEPAVAGQDQRQRTLRSRGEVTWTVRITPSSARMSWRTVVPRGRTAAAGTTTVPGARAAGGEGE